MPRLDVPFTIRPAQPSDSATILELIKGLAEYERLANAVTATEAQVHETLFGARAYAEPLIAELDGKPIGFALFFHNYSTFLAKPGIYLEDLFVWPEHRGQGYGKALLLEVVNLAKQRGCGRVEWSVLDWNEPSIAFYKSLGAQPMDDWTVMRLGESEIAQLGT